MICIDAFNKHCAIEPIKGKSDSDLALGLFECINKMGSPPAEKTDGDGAIKNGGLFHKHFTDCKIAYAPSRGHPVFAERMIKSFREMLDKRIKPNQQWTDVIYQISLT